MARKNRKKYPIKLKLYPLIYVLTTYLQTITQVHKSFSLFIMEHVTFRGIKRDAYCAFNNSAIIIQINLIFYTGLLISLNKLYSKSNDHISYHLPVINF